MSKLWKGDGKLVATGDRFILVVDLKPIIYDDSGLWRNWAIHFILHTSIVIK